MPRPLTPKIAAALLLFSASVLWAGIVYPSVWTLAEWNTNQSLLVPAIQAAKLAIAAAIGALVTSIHAPARRRRRSAMPVAHAQILFCVAGALLMIIIGDSLARAFGAVGIASIVRFRTPMKDPKDATVLFLLIGLGMSVGRGILAVSALGTLFVCLLLWLLDRTAGDDVAVAHAAPQGDAT